MNNNSSGNRFFDGFLWGAIIGGGLVFFLGTKKGKKLIKTLTEEGIDNLSELLEEYGGGEEEEDFEEKVTESSKTSNGNGVSKINSESQPAPTKSSRRFFRKKTS